MYKIGLGRGKDGRWVGLAGGTGDAEEDRNRKKGTSLTVMSHAVLHVVVLRFAVHSCRVPPGCGCTNTGFEESVVEAAAGPECYRGLPPVPGLRWGVCLTRPPLSPPLSLSLLSPPPLLPLSRPHPLSRAPTPLSLTPSPPTPLSHASLARTPPLPGRPLTPLAAHAPCTLLFSKKSHQRRRGKNVVFFLD
jgi:hypothetical protein